MQFRAGRKQARSGRGRNPDSASHEVMLQTHTKGSVRHQTCTETVQPPDGGMEFGISRVFETCLAESECVEQPAEGVRGNLWDRGPILFQARRRSPSSGHTPRTCPIFTGAKLQPRT